MNASTSTDDANREVKVASPSKFRPLRVWPPVVLLFGMIAVFVPDAIKNGSQWLQALKMMGPALCGILVLVWWLVASRARWQERLLGFVGILAAVGLTMVLIDRSMSGVPTIMVTIPMGMAAFAIGTILCRNVLSFKRTVIIVAIATVGFGFSTLLRGGGVWGGSGAITLNWRFLESPEQQLVASRARTSATAKPENGLTEFKTELMDQWLGDPEWPCFRGPERTSIVTHTILDTDWSSSPPEKLWTIPVGPGWSSFSVAGQLLFTQEQRGKMETVVCYSTESGEELWARGIESRFEDSIGGPGPRATPTIAMGDLFVMGANGQLMRMNAKSGEIQWQTDLRKVAKRDPPTWGFASSPLVIGSLVIVYAGGDGELGILAFNVDNGDLAWSVPAGNHSYSSPQLSTVGGESFVTILTNTGVDLINANTGEIRLAYRWKEPTYRCLQPRVVGVNSILLPSASGTRLIRITSVGTELSADEVWTSRFMKTDYNDLVVYEDHAYGFDGTIFSCLDLKTGERAWKGGRYGKGQVLLLEDAGLLLVLSESGKLVLLSADPSAHKELGSVNGIEGKTWNHPVVVRDRLYIRNSTQAACFRLRLSGEASKRTSSGVGN